MSDTTAPPSHLLTPSPSLLLKSDLLNHGDASNDVCPSPRYRPGPSSLHVRPVSPHLDPVTQVADAVEDSNPLSAAQDSCSNSNNVDCRPSGSGDGGVLAALVAEASGTEPNTFPGIESLPPSPAITPSRDLTRATPIQHASYGDVLDLTVFSGSSRESSVGPILVHPQPRHWNTTRDRPAPYVRPPSPVPMPSLHMVNELASAISYVPPEHRTGDLWVCVRYLRHIATLDLRESQGRGGGRAAAKGKKGKRNDKNGRRGRRDVQGGPDPGRHGRGRGPANDEPYDEDRSRRMVADRHLDEFLAATRRRHEDEVKAEKHRQPAGLH